MRLLSAVLSVAGVVPAQDPLAAVLASESRRAAVIARCAPAVCSVMSRDSAGGGSGVVFDPGGFVLTNYHVIGAPDRDAQPPEPPLPPAAAITAWREAAGGDATGDDEAGFIARWQAEWRREYQPLGASHYRHKKVGLPDGQLYEAVVLGIDPGSDLAVLRLLPRYDGQQWPSCALGDSDRLLVGETVLAMGNPFLLATDFTPTVTFGIVSGTHRYQEGDARQQLVYPDCIQVDAAVNPGNSGGPLFNEAGEVVGINGRISVGERGRVNVGVGFAIAANQIRNFLGDLMAGRHAEHGTLDMSAWFMAAGAGDGAAGGVFVQHLFRDSVVALAGVGLGDELLAFNGVAVRSANQLATLVGVLPAGAWVALRHRPALPDRQFGPEREVVVRLATVDTGSSRDTAAGTARLASRADRRLAKERIVAGFPRSDERGVAVRCERTGPGGAVWRALAAGDRLRLQLGGLVLEIDGGSAQASTAGIVREPTLDEFELLRRERQSNPLLWPRGETADRLAAALLLGGVHVHGAPAFRFELPGAGECEAWLFHDGEPAGCAYLDPVRKARVEWHVRGDALRVVVGGRLEPGWSAAPRATMAPAAAWAGEGR